jgi:hypothetical protein
MVAREMVELDSEHRIKDKTINKSPGYQLKLHYNQDASDLTWPHCKEMLKAESKNAG